MARPATDDITNGSGNDNAKPDFSSVIKPDGASAVLMLADGTLFWGRGVGAATVRVGEVCFNTSLTGYQEIMSDPSYATRSSHSPSRISGTSALTRWMPRRQRRKLSGWSFGSM